MHLRLNNGMLMPHPAPRYFGDEGVDDCESIETYITGVRIGL